MMFWKYIDAIDHPERVPFPKCDEDVVWDDPPEPKPMWWYEKRERRKMDSYRALMELIATRKGVPCG